MNKLKQYFKKIIHLYLVRLYKYFPAAVTICNHYLLTKKIINLKEPKTFNEKLEWLKVYYKNKHISLCTDKYEVRKYVIDKCNSNILNDLIGVFNNSKEIDWEKLPNSFIIKCTHGCGYNILVNNKDTINKEYIINKLDQWMKEDYGNKYLEPHYSYIKPRIIIEKLLGNGKSLTDYKVYCFNGKPRFIHVITNRDTENIKHDFYDLQWNRLHLRDILTESLEDKECPRTLESMIKNAKLLACEFPFVRVDFYEVDGKCIFGEMTFTPSGNCAKYSDKSAILLGDYLDISYLL